LVEVQEKNEKRYWTALNWFKRQGKVANSRQRPIQIFWCWLFKQTVLWMGSIHYQRKKSYIIYQYFRIIRQKLLSKTTIMIYEKPRIVVILQRVSIRSGKLPKSKAIPCSKLNTKARRPWFGFLSLWEWLKLALIFQGLS